MSDIEASELSAYLDGELSADRRRAVADRFASDAALRAEYDALATGDVAWRRIAQSAAFRPSIRWPRTSAGYVPTAAAVAIAVVLVALKLAPPGGVAIGLAVHAVALAVVLAGVVWLTATPVWSATAPPR